VRRSRLLPGNAELIFLALQENMQKELIHHYEMIFLNIFMISVF